MNVEREAICVQTKYVKHKIDKTAQSPFYRMCDKKSGTISPIVSDCEKLAQKAR